MGDNQQRQSYYCVSFNNRYTYSYNSNVSLPKTDFYKQNKVKKILVYDSYGKLNSLYELDTAGKIIRTGYPGHYFTVHGTEKISGWDDVSSTSYYEGSTLVRTDSNFTKQVTYKNGDTLLGYTHMKIKVCKIGYLINEQNKYYNDKFYLRYYKSTDPMHAIRPPSVIGKDGNTIEADPRGEILLHEKLKCNYDSMTFYSSAESFYNGNFYASKDSLKSYIDAPKKLSRHPFYRKYLRSKKNSYKTAGENFNEPVECHEAMWCGSSIGRAQQRINEQFYYSGEIKYNHKGLYDTYYQLYYPQDTSAAARDSVQKRQLLYAEDVKNGIRSLYSNEFNWYPRMKTPVKTLVYRISYEYF